MLTPRAITPRSAATPSGATGTKRGERSRQHSTCTMRCQTEALNSPARATTSGRSGPGASTMQTLARVSARKLTSTHATVLAEGRSRHHVGTTAP